MNQNICLVLRRYCCNAPTSITPSKCGKFDNSHRNSCRLPIHRP